jgi:hypothetical protein
VSDAESFTNYYRHLRQAGLLIYARFHQASCSFRIGCIGRIEPGWIDDLIAATRRFTQMNNGSVAMPGASPVAALEPLA